MTDSNHDSSSDEEDFWSFPPFCKANELFLFYIEHLGTDFFRKILVSFKWQHIHVSAPSRSFLLKSLSKLHRASFCSRFARDNRCSHWTEKTNICLSSLEKEPRLTWMKLYSAAIHNFCSSTLYCVYWNYHGLRGRVKIRCLWYVKYVHVAIECHSGQQWIFFMANHRTYRCPTHRNDLAMRRATYIKPQ
jgi:hypothetical protein